MRIVRLRPAWAAIAVVLALGAVGGRARAHAVGLSRGEYVLTDEGVTALLRFAHDDAIAFDPDALVRGVVVRANGRPCQGVAASTAPALPDGIEWRARFVCEDPRGSLGLSLRLLEDLPFGHRHAAHLRAGARVTDDVLYGTHDTAVVAIDAASSSPPNPGVRRGALGMVRMGIEHILTGYDHLAFLLAVVVIGGRARCLLGLVTAFSVAHSLTLVVAALGLWTPPGRIIEPAIALSIAYVGVENFFVRTADRRWRITFAFGLLHGFGFAGALRGLALPRTQVPAALLSFNVGVEVGQLLVLATLLPLLAALHRRKGVDAALVPALSAAIVVLSSVWFIARLARPGI